MKFKDISSIPEHQNHLVFLEKLGVLRDQIRKLGYEPLTKVPVDSDEVWLKKLDIQLFEILLKNGEE